MSMVWIASGSNVSGILRFSNIPQTFTHLQLRVFLRSTNAGTQDFLFMRPNNETTNILVSHGLYGNGSTAISDYISARDYAWLTDVPGGNATANVFGTSIIDILDYRDTNKNKTIRAIGGYDANGSGTAKLSSSVWLSTTAITTLDCSSANAAFAAGSRIDLYGITTSQVTGA